MALLVASVLGPSPATAGTNTTHTWTHTFTGGELQCGGIEIHNNSPEKKHIRTTFALQDSGTPHTFDVILDGLTQYSTAISSPAKTCLLETEIHLLTSEEHNIAQTGEIAPPPYVSPRTQALLEDWLAHDQRARQEEEDAANLRAWGHSLASAGLTEAERRQVVEQTEREIKAWLDTAARAAANDDRLRRWRAAYPGCIVKGPDDLPGCMAAKVRIDREKAEAVRAAAAQTLEEQRQRHAAAFAVAQARTRRAYRERAALNPCWGVQAFSAHYSEAPVAAEPQAWLKKLHGDCRRSTAPKVDAFGNAPFGPLDFDGSQFIVGVSADHVPQLKMHFVLFTSDNPNIVVLLLSNDPLDRMRNALRAGRLTTCRAFGDVDKNRMANEVTRQLPKAEADYAAATQAGRAADVERETVEFLSLQRGFLFVGQSRTMYSCKLNV